MAGKAAVENAVNGITGTHGRLRARRHATASTPARPKLVPLMEVANVEKKVPRAWINEAGNGVNQPVH